MTNLLGRIVTIVGADQSLRYEIVAVDSHEGWSASQPSVGGWSTGISFGATGWRQFSFLLKGSDGLFLVAQATACKLVD